MSESHHLAEALERLFIDSENGWYMPFNQALEGLNAAQAARIPALGFNSIWGVVNHVRMCTEVVLLRLRNQPIDRKALGAENDWPPAGNPQDEAAWQAACQRALSVNRELAQAIENLADEALEQPIFSDRYKRYHELIGLIAHNGYHTNEIISLRHMQGWWLAET